jgi:hypothetical protein
MFIPDYNDGRNKEWGLGTYQSRPDKEITLITAKVYLNKRQDLNDGQTSLMFVPDYNDVRNREWALYTPALSLNMTVKSELAAQFGEIGRAFTLHFEPEVEGA